ncbi:hypothetical protein AgCh_008040 [Apium graveolens]
MIDAHDKDNLKEKLILFLNDGLTYRLADTDVLKKISGTKTSQYIPMITEGDGREIPMLKNSAKVEVILKGRCLCYNENSSDPRVIRIGDGLERTSIQALRTTIYQIGDSKDEELMQVKAQLVEVLRKTEDKLGYNAKLFDFGLAKDGPTGHLTSRSDVYNFRVVLLEVIFGWKIIDKNRTPGDHDLVEWEKPYLGNKHKVVFRIIDSCLRGQYSLDVVHKATNLAFQCILTEPKYRPRMDGVVKEFKHFQNSKETGNTHRNQYSQPIHHRRSARDVTDVKTIAYPRSLTFSLYTK